MDKRLSREELDKLSTDEICALVGLSRSVELSGDLHLPFTSLAEYEEVVFLSPTKCKLIYSRQMIYNLYNSHYNSLELMEKSNEYWSAPVDKRCWKP